MNDIKERIDSNEEKVEISTITFNIILTALEKIDNASKDVKEIATLTHSVFCNFSNPGNRDFCNCGIADCRKALDYLKSEDNYNGYFII